MNEQIEAEFYDAGENAKKLKTVKLIMEKNIVFFSAAISTIYTIIYYQREGSHIFDNQWNYEVTLHSVAGTVIILLISYLFAYALIGSKQRVYDDSVLNVISLNMLRLISVLTDIAYTTEVVSLVLLLLKKQLLFRILLSSFVLLILALFLAQCFIYAKKVRWLVAAVSLVLDILFFVFASFQHLFVVQTCVMQLLVSVQLLLTSFISWKNI